MKSARHQAILDLIEKYPIDRQEDLLEHLRRAGFDVTQATVSRDIREPVLKVDYAGHMVLVKCFSGMANAACEVFDAQTWEGVVGTLSGDDTFFILMRTEENAAEITRQLQRYTVRHT